MGWPGVGFGGAAGVACTFVAGAGAFGCACGGTTVAAGGCDGGVTTTAGGAAGFSAAGGGVTTAAGGAGLAGGGVTTAVFSAAGAAGLGTTTAGLTIVGVADAAGACGLAAGGAAAGLLTVGGAVAAGRTGGAGGWCCCCSLSLSSRATSPGLEILERSIFGLMSEEGVLSLTAEPDLAAKCLRTRSASSSSRELEWVFFSVTPTSSRTSRIALLFTSSSLARSLIRIFIRSVIASKLCCYATIMTSRVLT